MTFELDRLSEYTDEALLAELRRVADLIVGESLTIAQFSAIAKIGVTTLRRRFGSWPKALEAAGLAHLCIPVAPASKSRTLARTLSSEEILEDVRRVAELTGKPSPTADDLRHHALVGVDAIRRRFGSLKAAVRAAGLVEATHARRYSDEECFENLMNIWMHYGRPPKYQELKLPPSVVGPKAYIVRWKTWNHALKAFVDRANQEENGSPVSDATSRPPVPVPRKPAALPEEDQHKIKLGLRYKILVRDNFKCVICGASPATSPNCLLHVDHIEPWSKGGKTVAQNLRTLCINCNLGKGDEHEAEGGR